MIGNEVEGKEERINGRERQREAQHKLKFPKGIDKERELGRL